jgi:TonB family protein
MRFTLLTLTFAFLLFAQTSCVNEKDMPPLVTFVAPAYPRAAKDQRIMGTTLTRIVVNREGTISDLRTIQAHPVFESYVLEALKQWRFRRSKQEHTLQITCSFELVPEKCEGTSYMHPITTETHVSAELPTLVRIVAGMQCQADFEKSQGPTGRR